MFEETLSNRVIGICINIYELIYMYISTPLPKNQLYLRSKHRHLRFWCRPKKLKVLIHIIFIHPPYLQFRFFLFYSASLSFLILSFSRCLGFFSVLLASVVCLFQLFLPLSSSTSTNILIIRKKMYPPGLWQPETSAFYSLILCVTFFYSRSFFMYTDI